MSWWDTRGQRWAALWTMTHILLSLSLQRLFWKPQPYISTDFLSLKRHRCTSAETGHHLNSNTSRLTEYVYRTASFAMSVWSLTHMNIMNMLPFPPLSMLGFLCLGERHWRSFQTYFYMFLSWYLQKPGHPPEQHFAQHTIALTLSPKWKWTLF